MGAEVLSRMGTALESRVVAEIERTRSSLIELLATLVGFDTRAPDPDLTPREEAALQEYLAGRLRAAGLQVETWEPDVASLPATRYQIPDDYHFDGRPQLAARAASTGGGRSLLLNGHIDVISAEPRELWTTDPFRADVRDGRLYGRGACDMKGGVAAMVFATEVLRALEVPLRGELIINTVTDEESTGPGALASIAHGVAADGGIVPEPTDMTAWLGTRGSLMPEIVVQGRAGHAGFPHEHWSSGGPVNAIEKMQTVLVALQALREEWRDRRDTQHAYLQTGTIVPTGFDAGQWIVSFPASATLRCHAQYLPAQADGEGSGEQVMREIEARVQAAARADPWLAAHPPVLRGTVTCPLLPRARGADLGHHAGRHGLARGRPRDRDAHDLVRRGDVQPRGHTDDWLRARRDRSRPRRRRVRANRSGGACRAGARGRGDTLLRGGGRLT